ncbi:hypothetical protein BGZ76_006943 [Entomortierella beljakovae]|nr:hypothetical protein BGZ76_006943 [Entomortierella beljakovae]
MPCGSSEPCCNNPKILIPKAEFTGDPEQASWVSEFSHIAPYAEIDPHEKKLLLRVRRDLVRTQNGGGFGATVSTTRWHKYGAFTVKLRSGSTGPGIITAFLLTNPTLGEQISFEFIGKDPKSVTTNFYRRVPAINTISSTKPPINMIPVDSSQPPSSFSPSYRLESHEKVHRLRHDTTKHDLVYKIEWTSEKISWSVGNKILRVVTSTDIDAIGGLPRDAMQLQLTIWDAGHSPETIEWAGGKAFYGPNNLDEYIAEISTVKIDCQNPTDSSDPWPGHDALSRLHSQDIKANISPRGRHVKAANSTKSFFRISILSIIKWICVMLSLIFGAAYFTEPKPRVSRRRTMDPLRASRPL